MPLIHPKQVVAGTYANLSNPELPLAMLFRVCAGVLSGVLLLYFCWQLAIELCLREAPYFLVEPAQAGVSAQDARAAAMTARIGLIRGDLWRSEALLLASGISEDVISDARSPQELRGAQAAAVRCVQLAPHDAPCWLLLALLDAKLRLDPRSSVEALKMSYYTGPGDLALLPWRLRLALYPTVIRDPDIRSLAEGEIQSVMREPTLRPVILSAYRQGSAEGKRFLEHTVGVLDADLLSKMKASEKQPQIQE
jgi:hypothetical protein